MPIENLKAENERLKKAIENFGKNPAGFDWAVLDLIDKLERAIERIGRVAFSRMKDPETPEFRYYELIWKLSQEALGSKK